MNHPVDRLIELLESEEKSAKSSALLRKNCSPKKLLKKVDVGLSAEGNSVDTLNQLIKSVVDHSVRTDHPLFMNQMYGKQQLMGKAGDIVSTMLNTSMYTYEVAPVMTLIEQECINRLCSFVWKKSRAKNGGVFTAGSSISNITAMTLARDRKFPLAKKNGLNGGPSFSIFVSDQAHYSFVKGAMFLGFGQDCIVKVKSDSRGCINIFELNLAIQRSKEMGRVPLMLVGIAGTTFTGRLDPIGTLGKIAKKHKMWYHVDGAFGASLLFSEHEARKFGGLEMADSLSWSLHKTMGVPLVCAVLLTKRSGILQESFSVDADYIFHDNDNHDLGQSSLQCGRRVDALKLWLAWKNVGDIGFEERIDSLMQVSGRFAEKVMNRDKLELYDKPETPLVCFRYCHSGFSQDQQDQLNISIRDEIFNEGKVLFNFATDLSGQTWLRCVIGDPEMTDAQLDFIIDRVEIVGDKIIQDSDNCGGNMKVGHNQSKEPFIVIAKKTINMQ